MLASQLSIPAVEITIALSLVMIQLVVFAKVIFPKGAIDESLRIVTNAEDSTSSDYDMAIGVFASLGRAAVVAGINSAIILCLHAGYNILAYSPFHHALMGAVCGLLMGFGIKAFITLPLENKAIRKLAWIA